MATANLSSRRVWSMWRPGILLGGMLQAISLTTHAQDIAACADAAFMPPFVYSAHSARTGLEDTSGITVDLIKMIAAERGWKLRLELLPWARCLRDADNQRYALVLNVGREEAQANRLRLSRGFFRLHGVYLFSRRLHPGGFPINNMSDLLRLRLCGMGGYRYEVFGIPSDQIDRGTTRSYEQLATKLHLGRCDIALATREEVAGMYLRNTPFGDQISDGSVGMRPLPGAPERVLHFGVPETEPKANAMLQALNDSLERFERSGVTSRLIDQHLEASEARRR